jgi:hypothetical protein
LLTTFFVTADGLGTQNNAAKITQNNSSLYTAIQEIARRWKEDSDTLPWLKARATSDENPDVRQADPEAGEGRRHRTKIGNHTFRATGITAYLKNSCKLEVAQHIANHEISPDDEAL